MKGDFRAFLMSIFSSLIPHPSSLIPHPFFHFLHHSLSLHAARAFDQNQVASARFPRQHIGCLIRRLAKEGALFAHPSLASARDHLARKSANAYQHVNAELCYLTARLSMKL